MKLKAKSYLIDTHAHVNFNAYKDDADEVLKRSLTEGVFVVNVGSQYSTSERAVRMAEKHKIGVWAAVGLHPIYIKENQSVESEKRNEKHYREEFDHKKYLELAKNPKVAAIGEMGLDYFHIREEMATEKIKKKQKEVFLAGIGLANETQKPMIIHCREAYGDLLEILKNNPIEKKGVIHCFVGGLKTAWEFIGLGYKIGLNGIITYSASYDRLIREIDLKDIVLETDCPYLSPFPRKGERNEPFYVKLVAEKIALLKLMPKDVVADITVENAKKIFKLET